MSNEAACAEIEAGKEIQFDPEVADILINAVKTGQVT